jgi:hypothetical protein
VQLGAQQPSALVETLAQLPPQLGGPRFRWNGSPSDRPYRRNHRECGAEIPRSKWAKPLEV